MEGKAASNQNLQGGQGHEEFEPLCKWQRNEERDILEVHLPEFKKEQLRVQISNHGLLKVSGERPLDSSRKSKFYKEFQLSSKYDASAIHAKFVTGWLYITMPKKKNFVSEKHDKDQVPGLPNFDQTPNLESKAPTANDNAGESKPRTQEPGPNNACAMNGLPGCKPPVSSGRRLVKVGVTLTSTAAMIAILIAYVVYMYRSTLPEAEIIN